MVADVDTFADGLLMGFTQLFTGVLTIFGTLLFMLRENVPITLVVVCITPLSFVVAGFFPSAAIATSRARAPCAANRPPL
jgi:ATP-binding cassette subfamily B protein